MYIITDHTFHINSGPQLGQHQIKDWNEGARKVGLKVGPEKVGTFQGFRPTWLVGPGRAYKVLRKELARPEQGQVQIYLKLSLAYCGYLNLDVAL